MRQGKKKCMKQQTTSIVPLAENKEKKKQNKEMLGVSTGREGLF